MEMNLVKNPDAEHVRVLRRMNRDKRVQVWRRLGRFEEVEELELGGEFLCECPMDKEEVFMLLPEGEGVLAGLQNLFLCWCARQVDDDFLRALVSAGCGKNLTSLTLRCECLFLLLSLVFFLWPCVSSVLRLALPLLGVASSLSPFPCTRSLFFLFLSSFPLC